MMNQGIVSPEALSVLKEQRSQLAVQYGLPPLGATMVNQHGIEWTVIGHAYMPNLASLARDKGEVVPDHPRDLLPIVVPRNLSPQLLEFLNELDRCTSRCQVIFDTVPHLRPLQAHRDGYSVDMFSDQRNICFFLDAAHIHETVLAHEAAHVWIDKVEDCEDYRTMRDLSDPVRVRQVLHVQSFVLDLKVNDVLERKGFDLGIIASHQGDAVQGMAQRVQHGQQPANRREAAFLALTIAATLWEKCVASQVAKDASLRLTHKLDSALSVLRHGLPLVYALAEDCATAVQHNGIQTREELRRSIDECLRLTFKFTGEGFEVDEELHEVPPVEPDFDKWPECFPGWPPAAKYEVGRVMAKNDIPVGSPMRLDLLPTGQCSVAFMQGGVWSLPVTLRHAPLLPPHNSLQPLPLPGGVNTRSPISHTVPPLPTVSTPRHRHLPPPLTPVVLAPSPIHGLIRDVMPAFGRRNYMPGIGRWLNCDPLSLDGGDTNLYRYVSNNPTSNIDPSGLFKVQGCKTKSDEKAVRDMFNRVCSVIQKYSPTDNVWKSVDNCIACQKGAGSFELPMKGKPSHPQCYQNWCTNGIVRCLYGKQENTCVGSAMCTDKIGTIKSPAVVINVAMSRTFDKNGHLQPLVSSSCSTNNATYPGCYVDECTGQGDIFYILHELQHSCGTGANATQHPAANRKACCILHNLFPVPKTDDTVIIY